jgi:hypothetical protein
VTVCESCRARVALERRTTKLLRASATPQPAPLDLRARLSRDLTRRARRRAILQRLPARYSVPLGIAASVAGVALYLQRPETPSRVESETLALLDHVARTHARNIPVEVVGPDVERVGSWFNGKVEFPVRPPHLRASAKQVNLLGARLSQVRWRDAATLLYDVGGHKVTVMVFDPGNLPLDRNGLRAVHVGNRDVYVGAARGRNVAVVQRGPIAYALSGDVDLGEMLQLAAYADAP